ncbi:hypothetical protein Tsubulata_023656 [Turnera subulata]|uniref:Uncharacterized protein n=1 Tax=Turnera subulata TaxID=218843 RepID=A0A9Q0FAJ8_9ROSI|nr:hypothetical protein Tsubulata_023656 [Turnera subulata]
MVTAIAEIPPTPEDGELWLPSDVFLEIESTNSNPETDNNECNNLAETKIPIDHGTFPLRRKGSISQDMCGPVDTKSTAIASPPHQGFKHRRAVSEGTGVFLPRNEGTGVFFPSNLMRPPCVKECSGGRRAVGTGVFINYQYMEQKYKKGEKNGCASKKKKRFAKKETQNKKSDEYDQFLADLYLPPEWIESTI